MEDDRSAQQRTEELLAVDREDIRAVLELRFGKVPSDILERIAALRRLEESSRLVLVAANADDLAAFRAEILAEIPAFRIPSGAFIAREDGRKE